jgi:hypothetical protein
LSITDSRFLHYSGASSVRVKQSSEGADRKQPEVTARYLHWKKLSDNLSSGMFARDTFAWEARRLILSILAYQYGLEMAEVETKIRDGTLPVPGSIRDLIERRIFGGSHPTPRRIERTVLRLRRLFLKVEPRSDSQMDDRIDEIVTFIENQLEFNHAGSQPQFYD